MKRPKIIFADLDDTLIFTLSGKTFAQGIWDMQLRLDVLNKIKEICPEYFFIVTNQGGIGKFVDENDFEKKLDYITVAVKSFIKHPDLAGVDAMYCPSMDKEDPFRKPNAGMLSYLTKTHDLFTEGYTKEDMLMIGDASGKEGNFSDTDLKTALNYGIKYLDVNDFLKTSFI